MSEFGINTVSQFLLDKQICIISTNSSGVSLTVFLTGKA